MTFQTFKSNESTSNLRMFAIALIMMASVSIHAQETSMQALINQSLNKLSLTMETESASSILLSFSAFPSDSFSSRFRLVFVSFSSRFRL